jgi:membrane protein DedA with SNARE-associated domain
MLPAMLPPPTPFKLFVLAAAGFEMRFPRFLLAIFAGRCIRFLLLALLTIRFGPQFVRWVGDMFRQHFRWLSVAAAASLLIWLVWRRRKGRRVL